MASHISPFLFEGEHLVRAIDRDGNAWFVAKDVCQALGIIWQGDKTINKINFEWKMVGKLPTISGEKDTIFISEPGVYKLAFRSNKPEAERFTNWLAGEVLPSIRKTGSYEMPKADKEPTSQLPRPFPDWSLDEMRTKCTVTDRYSKNYGVMAAQWCMTQLGFPVPPKEIIDQGLQYAMAFTQPSEIQQ